MRYELRIVGTNLKEVFRIPLDGITNIEQAVERSNKLMECLNDSYIVEIDQISVSRVGYNIGKMRV